MQRDAHSNFADSPGLREQIETALERQAIERDLKQIGNILRFWNNTGRRRLDFQIVGKEVEVTRYGHDAPGWVERTPAANGD